MNTFRNTPTPKFPTPSAPMPRAKRKIVYPDRDGKPMSDNTLQFQWIVTIEENLNALFANDPQVFVAGDLLWYPVEGDNKTRTAPDALVAFGARKGYRGSYKQWEEGFPPQVVFEVLSPRNRAGEMNKKRAFYETYGVEEYYVYNPYKFGLKGYIRDDVTNLLSPTTAMDGFVSPRLGIRFDAPGTRELVIYRPDGVRFKTPLEVQMELERTAAERDRVAAERDQANAQRTQANVQRDRANAQNDVLAAKLRELGIDPATL